MPISQPLKHPQKKFWAFSNSPFRGLLENVQKLKDWVKIGRDIHKSMKRKENLNVKIARIYEQSFSNLFPFQFKMFFFYSDQFFCRRIRGIQICIPVQSMVFYFFFKFRFQIRTWDSLLLKKEMRLSWLTSSLGVLIKRACADVTKRCTKVLAANGGYIE